MPTGTTSSMVLGIDREKWNGTRTGGDNLSLWRSTWHGNSSEKEYEYSDHLSSFRHWEWLWWAHWAGPAMRFILYQVLTMNDVTLATQTLSVNWSRQTPRIRRNFVVHGLSCCYRPRKCCSDLSSLKTVLCNECEKDWCTVKNTFVHIGIF